MKWSVLDQSPFSAGSTQGAAIRESIALAQHCDKLGYERYWVSEHHNSTSIVGTAAQVAEKLHALARRLALDEIVINTWTFDPQARVHSYSLLAEAFSFSAAASQSP
jgi:alkanesulfonate monooxygenase SsuD/methylene tetrahydromethanopterin reductase-like flavin-dependent oxidoreductase (luciferase family)